MEASPLSRDPAVVFLELLVEILEAVPRLVWNILGCSEVVRDGRERFKGKDLEL
jgi:hypothetical protein